MQQIGILRVQCRILFMYTRTSSSALYVRLQSKDSTNKDDLIETQEEDKLDFITTKFQNIFMRREKHKKYKTCTANLVANEKNKVDKNMTSINFDLNNEQEEYTFPSSTQLNNKVKPMPNNAQIPLTKSLNANSNNCDMKIGEKFSGEKRLERMQFLLKEAFTATKSKKDLQELETRLRQEDTPSFETLLRACAWASKSSQSEVIHKLLSLTQLLYPLEYEQNLGLKYYLASSLCYGGQVEEGLTLLRLLYRQHPQPHKKLRDTTNFIIYHLTNTGEEEHEEMVLRFVSGVAEEVGELSPALTLWRATFCSPTFRLQRMSEGLLERHPKLVKKMERKVPGLLSRATWEGDEEALRRLLQLILKHDFKQYYHTATIALLKLQCDLGDLSGAEETLKFSQRVGVILSPGTVARVLTLLAYHRRPAPLALLALKYRPVPPPPTITHPPKKKYKF